MDRKTIIDGLKMTMELCVFDPSTGEEIEPHLLNDINRATYDACRGALEILEQLPSAHPEIIRCRECKFASGDSRICMKFGHSPIGELDFCAWAERRTDG